MIKPLFNQPVNIYKPAVNKIADMSNSELVMETFTPSANKLIKKIDKLICDTWIYARKNKQQMQPEYTLSTRGCDVVVKALYRNNKEDSILFDISEKNRKITERFIIDRRAQNYTYEKILKTEHGSATVKTYDSKTKQCSDIDTKLNNYIEEFFPKIFIRNRKIMS